MANLLYSLFYNYFLINLRLLAVVDYSIGTGHLSKFGDATTKVTPHQLRLHRAQFHHTVRFTPHIFTSQKKNKTLHGSARQN